MNNIFMNRNIFYGINRVVPERLWSWHQINTIYREPCLGDPLPLWEASCPFLFIFILLNKISYKFREKNKGDLHYMILLLADSKLTSSFKSVLTYITLFNDTDQNLNFFPPCILLICRMCFSCKCSIFHAALSTKYAARQSKPKVFITFLTLGNSMRSSLLFSLRTILHTIIFISY